MKKRVILFTSLLLILSSINIFTPTRIFSDKENKYLMNFPTLSYNTIISGKFGQEFNSYVNDQFVFRDNWITLKTLTDLAMGKQSNGRVYFGRDGFLFDKETDFEERYLIQNLEKIKSFESKVDKDIDISFLLIPGKGFALKQYMPRCAPILDENSIKTYITNNFKNVIDLYSKLQKPSYYYKTDHHWTLSGAYIGYKELMDYMNIKPIELHEELVNQDFLGTQYRKANYYKHEADKIYKQEQDYGIINNINIDGFDVETLYDESYLSKTDKYSYYLGGDAGIIKIKTKSKNKEKILIIKDSFANSLVPFLISHFDEITIIDPRYYKKDLSQLVNKENISKVVFIFNVENFGKKGRFAFF